MSRDRIVLFGASSAGEFFIENNTSHEILAIADNDTSKHGTTFLKLNVISPAEILDLDFDYVYITSQWADQISHQLHELGISKEKVVLPKKIDIKADNPFQDQKTKELGHQLIRCINNLMTTHGVELYLDSGTLLGIVRDKDLIAWDDDIDFAVNENHFSQALDAMRGFNNVAPYRNSIDWSIEVLSMLDQDVAIIINFKNKAGESYIPFETSVQMRREVDGNSELVSSAGLFYVPAQFFTGYDEIPFQDIKLKGPKNHTEFLRFMYGDWQSPKKEMKITDYQNRRINTNIDPRAVSIRKRTLESI